MEVSVFAELEVSPLAAQCGDGTVSEGDHLKAVAEHSFFYKGCLRLGTGSGTN